MKTPRRQALSRLGAFASLPALAAAAAAVPRAAQAQAQAASPPVATPGSSSASSAAGAPGQPPLPTFAVEIRTGPAWDAKKPPLEQAQFREHSAHLRRLRDEGHILFGARYGDKGLLVVAAADDAAVRTLFDADPSMKAGTFAYELHALSVFYGGCIQPSRRRSG